MGDMENADDSGVLYGMLMGGRCREAQDYLDAVWWHSFFESPEYVVLFQVGIDMCRGDRRAAADLFARGTDSYRWQGVAQVRNLRNLVLAYTDAAGEPDPCAGEDALPCWASDLAPWPPGPHLPYDDPRTVAVEGRTLRALSVSRGPASLPGNPGLDLDTGEVGMGEGVDLWWDNTSPDDRWLRPQGGTTLVVVDGGRYEDLGIRDLVGLRYADVPLDGRTGPTNQVPTGTVIAVRIDADTYAKVRVTKYDSDLELDWETLQVS
ncbi:hypothetical protein [Kineosporia sp. R_H_3]|uniref:hypothetical protein n=1 Tax=Kineosporia sp. R_H_3 TaxID=1961848 RepID=UPI00117A3808|nr:hypothetical protein [Kineosporia sp. R_H_3]